MASLVSQAAVQSAKCDQGCGEGTELKMGGQPHPQRLQVGSWCEPRPHTPESSIRDPPDGSCLHHRAPHESRPPTSSHLQNLSRHKVVK